MSLVRFRGSNHPQQVKKGGALDEIDDRGTHPTVFDPLHERFGFTIDVAAAPHNTKCERYFTREEDGLVQSWAGERVWCNPPYSNIAAWVRKAWDEWCEHEWLDSESTLAGVFKFCPKCDREEWGDGTVKPGPRAELIVMLLPANRTEQKWWQDLVEPRRDRPGSPLHVQFMRDRIRFIKPGQTDIGPNERPPFGSCLLIWTNQPTEGTAA